MTTGAKAGSSLLPRHPELVSGSSWPPARTSALQIEAAAPPVKASAPQRRLEIAPGTDFSSWRPNEIKDLEIGAWHQFLPLVSGSSPSSAQTSATGPTPPPCRPMFQRNDATTQRARGAPPQARLLAAPPTQGKLRFVRFAESSRRRVVALQKRFRTACETRHSTQWRQLPNRSTLDAEPA